MAKAIMIQGTMSNAGKSIFAAALCRIFKEDGYRAAPFKSQNMALNSYVTADGLEMGRAQVMQAQAAGIEPDVRMNPILLKPTTDSGSQVIVNGEIVGNMRAANYFKKKRDFIPDIVKAYDSLASEYDIIVIEGAGSPVELNLKSDDIVNMGIAKLFNAPVLIVGDIDRGGIFAQLLGTYHLLEEDEKKLVKGFVVNKFRGDRTLFEDGVSILKEKSGIDVIGVVPYLDVDIDDEDSLSTKLTNGEKKDIDIAVIKLPKISNFTDFDVFNQYENVSVRYVESKQQLDRPDMIIIPGTKSTMEDLMWMRRNGLEDEIKRMAAENTPVFGICGGFQMLGRRISDMENAESKGTVEGMCLLPVNTVFEKEKKRTRVKGVFDSVSGIFSELSKKGFEGYEIHMGRTEIDISAGDTDIKNMTRLNYDGGADVCMDGVSYGNVYGSYVHGIFDEGDIADTIVKKLAFKKGVFISGRKESQCEYRQKQYEKLAKMVRKNIDMDKIYEIMDIKKFLSF